MKQGKRKILLRPHFKQRWHERINSGTDYKDSDNTMRRVLHSALLEKAATHHSK